MKLKNSSMPILESSGRACNINMGKINPNNMIDGAIVLIVVLKILKLLDNNLNSVSIFIII